MQENSDYVLIMYHHSCADGTFSAAIAALAEYPNEVIYLPLSYSKDNAPIKMKNKNGELIPVEESSLVQRAKKIVIVDFSLREDQLAIITNQFIEAKKSVQDIRVYDHHNVRTYEKYEEECTCRQKYYVNSKGEPLPVQLSKELIFNSGGSGALTTLMKSLLGIENNIKYNYGTIARVAQLVSDRDTWKRHKKDAFAFYDATSSEIFASVEPIGVPHKGGSDTTVSKARDILMEPLEYIDKLIATGYEIQAEVAKEIRKIHKDAVICEANEIVPVRHLVFTAHRGIASEACAQYLESEVATQNKIGLCLVVRRTSDNNIAVSARSKVNHESEDKVLADMDEAIYALFSDKYPELNIPSFRGISEPLEIPTHLYGAKNVAIRNGGNGHQDAAGFSLSVDNFIDAYGHPLKEKFNL